MLQERPTTYRLTATERQHLSESVNYSDLNALPDMWRVAEAKFGDTMALYDPHSEPEVRLSFRQLSQKIQQFASGLQAMGVKAGDRVGFVADDSPRWMIADQGIMMAGAVDAVRSSQAEREEVLYILQNSGSSALVVEDAKTFKKLRDRLYDLPISLIVFLSDETPPNDEKLNILNFNQLMAAGENRPLEPVTIKSQDLATLIYTSGTTGKPKGVMLTHANLLHQINNLATIIQPHLGDLALTLLPTWHSFGRTAEYYILSQGASLVYTNIRYVKKDFKDYKPQYMVGVPRLWESIYEGVQKQFREQPIKKQKFINTLINGSLRYVQAKRTLTGMNLLNLKPSFAEKAAAALQLATSAPLHALGNKLVYGKVREATGGKLKYVISGGGSLAAHLDNFFEAVGIGVLVGYGLTETAPVLSARRPERNLRGTAGQPIPGTEIRIVDPETRITRTSGQRGLVLARGPQVMAGYYQNPEATAKAIDPEGWFDTGDLGWMTPQNDLVLTGRAKDTIVLTNGENIEPQPIEDACLRSPYIDQIMLVGQDQRVLGALIVPNLEALQQWAMLQNRYIPLPEMENSQGFAQLSLEDKTVQDLFRQELLREVQNRPGYRPDDRIGPFRLILEPFSVDNGMMTQTLKIRRPVVTEHYRDMIDGMFTTNS